MKVIENDSKINDVKVTCKTAESHQSFVKRYEKLDNEYNKLEAMNLQLKKELFD